MRKLLAEAVTVAVAVLALSACGEPPIDVDLPAREPGQQVLDLAGVLDEDVDARLRALREDRGLDVVALTYETDAANCGEAFRAGGAIVTRWEADVAVVAVARPGDFTSTASERRTCFGLRPRDEFSVSKGLREEIVEVIAPPLTDDNQWSEAVLRTASRLASERF